MYLGLNKYNFMTFAANNESGAGNENVETTGTNTEESIVPAKENPGEGDESSNDEAPPPKKDTDEGEGAEGEAAGESGEGDEDTSEQQASGEKKDDPWWKKQLNKQHGQKKELERKLADSDAEKANMRKLIEKLTAQGGDGNEAEAGEGNTQQNGEGEAPQRNQFRTEAEYTAAVNQAAQEIVAKQEYDRNCNRTYDEGLKTYGAEWKEAMENIQMLGIDQTTMNGVLATDNPTKVLYDLGKNPEKLQSILEMSPEKRIVEMAKMASTKLKVKKISNAPPPVDEVRGGAGDGKVDLSDPKLNDDTWMAERRAQKREKFEASQRR